MDEHDEVKRYGAQGGDWGSSISRELGLVAPGHLAGVHLNMLFPHVRDEPADFAAMEVPDLLVGDVRDFFRPLR